MSSDAGAPSLLACHLPGPVFGLMYEEALAIVSGAPTKLIRHLRDGTSSDVERSYCGAPFVIHCRITAISVGSSGPIGGIGPPVMPTVPSSLRTR